MTGKLSLREKFIEMDPKQKRVTIFTVILLAILAFFAVSMLMDEPKPQSNNQQKLIVRHHQLPPAADVYHSPVTHAGYKPQNPAKITAAYANPAQLHPQHFHQVAQNNLSPALRQLSGQPAQPIAAQPHQQGNATQKMSAPPAPKPATPQVSIVAPPPISQEQSRVLSQERSTQQQYMDLLNQYQLLQMQVKVEQIKGQLANAKFQTVETQQKTDELTGKTAREAAESEKKDWSSSLEVGFDGNITLVYVGKEKGKWKGMIKDTKNFYTVFVGTRLPDGSVVSQIKSNSVTLFNNGDRHRLVLPTTLDKPQTDDSQEPASQAQTSIELTKVGKPTSPTSGSTTGQSQ